MELQLTEEMFYGLLQGKKLEQIFHLGEGKSTKWTIYPPHYGLYLTHAQIAEIKRAAAHDGRMELFNLIEKITTPPTI